MIIFPDFLENNDSRLIIVASNCAGLKGSIPCLTLFNRGELMEEYKLTTHHAYIVNAREERAPEMDAVATNKYITDYLKRCKQRLIYLNKEARDDLRRHGRGTV